jgi:Spy/CpxP family protein refolding chaperone
MSPRESEKGEEAMHPGNSCCSTVRPAAAACCDWSVCAPAVFGSSPGAGWERVVCAPAGGGWGDGSGGSGGDTEWGGAGGGGGGGGGEAFGVRRPLRFLAYKLDLDDRQVAELARILNDLKTERAQAEVDRRRTVAALADAVAGETFDGAKAGEGAKLRVASAERLRDAVLAALTQIHALLDAEQRSKLAYLIRTGTLLI